MHPKLAKEPPNPAYPITLAAAEPNPAAVATSGIPAAANGTDAIARAAHGLLLGLSTFHASGNRITAALMYDPALGDGLEFPLFGETSFADSLAACENAL